MKVERELDPWISISPADLMVFLERMRTEDTERCRVASVELLVIQYGEIFASLTVFRYWH